MADRYWVGGTGTWDATTPTNWATTSGGAGGASAPTSADNVFFDAGSDAAGSFTVTIGLNAVCADITAGGLDATMTLTGSAAWSIYGSLTFPATNFTRLYSGEITFKATTTGKTITTNGATISSSAGNGVTFDGVGGSWTLGSSLTASGNIDLKNGTFNSNGFNVTANAFTSNYTNTRALTLGASTLTFSSSSPLGSFGLVATNLTLTAGTSTIVCSGATSNFVGNGLTYYNVSFTNAGAGTKTLAGVNTFNNLTFTSVSSTGRQSVALSNDQIVNGVLTFGTANTAIRRFQVGGSTVGTVRTFTVNGTVATLADVDFREITAAGTFGTWAGTRLGNAGNNTNITFAAGKTVYRVGTGNWSATQWALTSGGAVDVNNFPLVQDTAVFDTGTVTGTHTIDTNWWIGTVNMSALAVAVTLASGSTNPEFYGDITLDADVTVTGTGTWAFGGAATQTITSAGKTLPVAITENKPAGVSLVLADDLTMSFVGGGAFTQTAGTLNLNNNTLSCYSFYSTNSNVRTVAFGTTGKLLLTGNATTVFNTGTKNNLTITGTCNVTLSYSGSTGTRTISPGFVDGANTFSFKVSGGTDAITVTTNHFVNTLDFDTFAGTFNNTGFVVYGSIIFSSGMTPVAGANVITFITATATVHEITTNGKLLDFPLNQSTTSPLKLKDALTIGSTRTYLQSAGTLDLNGFDLSCGIFSSANVNLRSVAFGTNKIVVTGNNATVFNMNNATNFTYTGTPTVEFNYAGSTGTRTIRFGDASGGTETNCVNFKFIAGTDTVASNAAARNYIRDLDFTGFAGTSNIVFDCYGDLTTSAGMTWTATASTSYLSKTTGTQNVTSNGKTLDFPLLQQGTTGVVNLVDNLTLGSTRTYTLNGGTLQVNGKTLSTGNFVATGATSRSIAMGTNGKITIVGSGATAFNASSTGLTTSGTGTISMTSASAKTFAGGGASYPTLNQGGAGTLTITGANTFYDITNTVNGCTVTFPASTTTTTQNLSLSGASGSLVSVRSSTPGARATLSSSAVIINSFYLDIQDSAATGTAVFNATTAHGNVDSGNNTGWLFVSTPVSITEQTTLSDQESYVLAINVSSQNETQTVTEASSTAAIFVGNADETETLTEDTTSLCTSTNQAVEQIELSDDLSSLAVYNSSETETMTVYDTSVGRGWTIIQNPQNPNWTVIDNSQ